MLRDNCYTVRVLYSTIEYDVILGIITDIKSKSNIFKVNDIVFVYLKWYNDEGYTMDSLRVEEETIFRFTDNNYNKPYMLPLLKYGCIAMHISDYYVKKIVLYSSFNVYHCLKNILHCEMEWHNITELPKNNNCNDMFMIITPTQWYYTYDTKNDLIDLEKQSIFQNFGRKTITKLIKYIELKSLTTNICYIDICDLISIKNSNTRFFKILDFNQNSSL